MKWYIFDSEEEQYTEHGDGDFIPFFDKIIPVNEHFSTFRGLREALNNIFAKKQKVRIKPGPRVSDIFDKIMGEISKIDKDSAREETELSLMMEFWRQRNRGKIEALIQPIGALYKNLEELAFYPAVREDTARSRWTWTFGEPDGQGGRVARDILDWYGEGKPENVLRKVDMVPLIGGTYRDVERWENHKRGFNPYRAYWPSKW